MEDDIPLSEQIPDIKRTEQRASKVPVKVVIYSFVTTESE